MGPKAIWREDMITSLLATALVAGLFLDGWNHINLQNGALGEFWTIWHGLLYLGFTASAFWAVTRNPHLYTRGAKPRPYFHPLLGVPLRYPLAIGGLALATIGLFGDIAWHTAFGPESGVARVIAPFHLFLFVAAAALASAPLRSAWYAPGYYPSASSLRTILPPLISLTLVTCVAAFMFQWLNAFLDWTPSVTVGHVPADLARDARTLVHLFRDVAGGLREGGAVAPRDGDRRCRRDLGSAAELRRDPADRSGAGHRGRHPRSGRPRITRIPDQRAGGPGNGRRRRRRRPWHHVDRRSASTDGVPSWRASVSGSVPPARRAWPRASALAG